MYGNLISFLCDGTIVMVVVSSVSGTNCPRNETIRAKDVVSGDALTTSLRYRCRVLPYQ